MRSFRSLLGASRSAIATRLDRLRATLDDLGERLRLAVAQAIGQNVGAIVREAFLAALPPPETDWSRYRHTEYDSYSGSARSWEQPEEPNWRQYESYHDPYAQEEQHEYQDYREYAPASQEEQATQPSRMPAAVATGLRAAAWWLRHWWGYVPAVGAIAVGLVAGCVAFFAGPLADAGLSLVESVDQLSAVKKAARAGTDRLR